MQTTLVIIKPSGIQRAISGEVISRFEKKGLIIAGMKMMELSEKILREHYAHLVERPFFPSLLRSMMASPVIVMAIKGVDAVEVVRGMPASSMQAKSSTTLPQSSPQSIAPMI